jgi:hypothetical protein
MKIRVNKKFEVGEDGKRVVRYPNGKIAKVDENGVIVKSDKKNAGAVTIRDDGEITVSSPALPCPHIPEGDWWTWEEFPLSSANRGGKPWSITPKQVKDILDEYSGSTKPLSVMLGLKGLHCGLINRLGKKFPMVWADFVAARQDKAGMFGDEAIKIFTNDIPKEFWFVDKQGNNVLNMAGVRYMEAKSEAMYRAAAACETGSYVERQRIEQRNINLNISTKPIDIEKLGEIPLESLLKPDD